MAVFGAPAALEDHAERALHAALAMRRRLEGLFGARLAIRTGVNTGEVVVGRPRSGSLFVSGDAVNVAARLEQAAAPGEILVGERTAAAARGAFELGEPRTVAAKGKPAGVVCRSLGRALSLMRPRGTAALGPAFVGRSSELDELDAAYRAVCERRAAQLVLVIGDSGIGKSRLAREFWSRLEDESPPPLRRTGRCLSYGRGTTYWPLGEVLKEHLELLETDPPEAILRRLGAREILGLTLGLDVAGELHPLAARDRLHEAWVTFLSELVRDRPGVLLLEDLHWAEEPLLELIEWTASDVDGPLLVIATAPAGSCSTRSAPARRPPWSTRCRRSSGRSSSRRPRATRSSSRSSWRRSSTAASSPARMEAGRRAPCRRASPCRTRSRRCSRPASTCSAPRRRPRSRPPR
jgi:hypothetical protein